MVTARAATAASAGCGCRALARPVPLMTPRASPEAALRPLQLGGGTGRDDEGLAGPGERQARVTLDADGLSTPVWCPQRSSCPGGSNASCAVGHSGPLCGVCDAGYYRSDGGCWVCESASSCDRSRCRCSAAGAPVLPAATLCDAAPVDPLAEQAVRLRLAPQGLVCTGAWRALEQPQHK